MATNFINARIKNKRDTASNFESNNPILLHGELVIVDDATGGVNIKIGDGVIIAANSVVTHDIPSFCVAGGNPAKILKKM